MERAYQHVPEAVRQPTSEDIAWAAGFIEGEGSFVRVVMGSGCFGFRISASQKNIEPLLKLQEIFGGSIKPKKKRTIYWKEQGRSITSEPSNIWRLYGKMAIEVTKMIFPYLSKRRQNQAMELLDVNFISNLCDKGPKRLR